MYSRTSSFCGTYCLHQVRTASIRWRRVRTFVNSLYFYETTRRHNSDCHLHMRRCENRAFFDTFFAEGGVVLVPKRGCLLTLAYYVFPRWYEFLERRWNYILTGEKPVPVPLCPPQIPHGLTLARTRASAVRGRRLTTWDRARPSLVLNRT
jgi:hypothetical protein